MSPGVPERQRNLGLDDLMEIAEAIQAPAECVRRQVENHRLARIDIGS